MHGMIFTSLKDFVTRKGTPNTWKTLFTKANLPYTVYVPLKLYPDTDVVKLCTAAAEVFNISLPEFLEAFGKQLIKDLIAIYKGWMKPEWNSLQFILNVESIMHVAAKKVSSLAGEQAHPPILHTEQLAPNQIRLTYQSPRKLCFLAKGLLLGIAEYYKEPLEITETSCMYKDSDACRFHIKLLI